MRLQGFLVFANSPVGLVPFQVQVPHELMHFRIRRPPGIDGRHCLECVVDHLKPVKKFAEEKLEGWTLWIPGDIVFVNRNEP